MNIFKIRLLFSLLAIAGFSGIAAQLPAPQNFSATPFERHVEIRWDAVPGAVNYQIWRSENGGADFSMLKNIVGGAVKFHLDWTGDEGLNLQRIYKIRAVAGGPIFSDFSDNIEANTFTMTDDELMEMVSRATFRYFWEGAHPVSGMARERNNSGNTVTSGGTGFGVMTMVVAAERGWVSREDVVNRLLQIVSFLQIADRFHGVFPHWMDGNTGNVIPFSQYDDGADLVETAFLMQGLLTVRQYFSENNPNEKALRDVITGLWEDVEWDFFRKNNSPVLYWHWSPKYEWQMNFQLRGFNETMICYLLGAASPTHPIPASLYTTGWTAGSYGTSATFYNHPYFCGPYGGGPMFFAHYSFLGFDPRNKKDKFCNYFTRNKNHALIQIDYSIANPEHHAGYSADCWGLTASDDPWGYLAHDVYPANDNGTISPTAALASMPYVPAESMAALRHFYQIQGEKLWGEHGFFDAFNLDVNWFATSYLAIDQGPIVCMIENHRTGLLWEKFMSNPEIQPALDAIGFLPDFSATGDFSDDFEKINLAPNPARVGELLKISSENTFFSHAILTDPLGRSQRQIHFSNKNGAMEIPTTGLPSGIYFLKMEMGNGKIAVRRVVLE